MLRVHALRKRLEDVRLGAVSEVHLSEVPQRNPYSRSEANYWDQLAAFVVSPEMLRAHAEAADEQVQEAEGLVAATEVELAKVENEAHWLYRLYMDEGLSQDDFTRKHRPLSERRGQLEDKLPPAPGKRDVLKISAPSEAVVQTDAMDLASGWDRLQGPEKRQLVETVTDRIVVGRRRLRWTSCTFPLR